MALTEEEQKEFDKEYEKRLEKDRIEVKKTSQAIEKILSDVGVDDWNIENMVDVLLKKAAELIDVMSDHAENKPYYTALSFTINNKNKKEE